MNLIATFLSSVRDLIHSLVGQVQIALAEFATELASLFDALGS